MRKDFLVFGAPLIGDAEINEVVETLKTGWIGTGPRVSEFEQKFCEYTGAKHAVAVNSCTAALNLSLIAADIGPGDEVITTPLTFCATVNAIIHRGATPVLADVDARTMNLTASTVATAITDRTKAILPVHFAGHPCDMSELCELADKHRLTIVEDCAHAIEARDGGQHVGNFGRFGCYSFYATKNLATGEGGMITCDNEEDAKRLRVLALHGMDRDAWKRFSASGYRHYDIVEPGFKYNMMDLQAALGLHQLARIEQNLLRRAEIWQQYNNAFAELPVTLPAEAGPEKKHALHLYTLLVEDNAPMDRDTFLAEMRANNLGVGVHYQSVASYEYYQREFGWDPANWPNTDRIGRRTVSIPFSAALTSQDVLDVVETVQKLLKPS